MHKVEERFSGILGRAEKECRNLEVFPGYFRFKKEETLLILSRSGFIEKGPVLEIGCGTGFQSLLLSACCDRIVSTDLPDFSGVTHTIGIKNAKEIALKCGIGSVKHLGCSVINLPFKDKSFGCVFSSGVLEHIDDKNAALREMRRVLKDDGIVVCNVPTYMESIFEFPAVYLYIAKRLYELIINKLFRINIKSQSIFFVNETKNSKRGMKELLRSFFKNNPSLPFPKPHGDWRNKDGKQSIFAEFRQQLPWKWSRMFLNNGLKVINSFAVLFIPYRIIEIFSPRLLTNLYCNSRFFHRRLGGSFLKYFSISICYVARKAD